MMVRETNITISCKQMIEYAKTKKVSCNSQGQTLPKAYCISGNQVFYYASLGKLTKNRYLFQQNKLKQTHTNQVKVCTYFYISKTPFKQQPFGLEVWTMLKHTLPCAESKLYLEKKVSKIEYLITYLVKKAPDGIISNTILTA